MCNTASAKMTIANRLGLHARPAMMFVEAASNFASEIQVCRCDSAEQVDGKSIMQMMMLAATKGTEITITAIGEDADQALTELQRLVESRFEED